MEAGRKRPTEDDGQDTKKKNKSPPEPTLPNVDPVCSGVISKKHEKSRDIKINSFSLSIAGNKLATSSELTLQYGRCYGLIGSSGCGKSALLKALASNKTPIPTHMEICVPAFEANHGHLSLRQYVTSCEEEKEKMLQQSEILSTMVGAKKGGGGEALPWLRERLKILEEDVERRALDILYGLGFDKQMQAKKAQDLTNGWRMRLALAKALFLKPAVLLLDEPTVNLDLGTSIWLAVSLEALKQKCILVVISNDEDFLNKVCSDIIHIRDSVLKQFEGTYDQYVESNEVTISNKAATFQLPNNNVGRLASPVLQLAKAAYGYSADKVVFKNLDFNIDLSSRIALVGAKGSGKTTLLKLLAGKLSLQGNGKFARNSSLHIGYFDQHAIKGLDLNCSVRHILKTKKLNEGDFGFSRAMLDTQIKSLSHGQKVLVVFACLAARKPQLLLIDDPTVHLDIESISSLGNALKKWKGAFILVSSNVRLINQVSSDIWICGSQGIIKHSGDIMTLKKKMEDHDSHVRKLQSPMLRRDSYPLFGASNYNEVALHWLCYDQYVDNSYGIFIPGCIPFDVFIEQRAMVASAPSIDLEDGELELQGEINPEDTYRLLTEPGKLVIRSMLENIQHSESLGESFGDFDSSHLWVTPSGMVIFKGVKRQKLCPVGLRKSHLAAHAIIKEMCSRGGDIPVDVQYLLDMIELEPDMSPLYHIQSCLVPLSRYTGFFMKMVEHVLKTMDDPVARDQILLQVPFVDNQEWHRLVKSNVILMETYTYNKAKYTSTALPGHVFLTAQQHRDRRLLEAKNFLDFLRNRVCHRMDYLQNIAKYTAEGSDLAALVRFSLVSSVLQKELFKANQMGALNLHQFL